MKGLKDSMNDHFEKNEKLYRAICPPEVAALYWKRDGSLSYRAFADPKGLSVDRGYDRSDAEVVDSMKKRLKGMIARVYVRTCLEVGATVKYLPSAKNPYHSEIHGSENEKLLSKHQCFYLAGKTTVL